MHRVRWTLEKIRRDCALWKAESIAIRWRCLPSNCELHGQAAWQTLSPGTYWGDSVQDFQLRTQFRVPANFQVPFALQLPLGTSASLEALALLYGPEALAYLDGAAYQGINPSHPEIILDQAVRDGSQHEIVPAVGQVSKTNAIRSDNLRSFKLTDRHEELVTRVGVALATIRNLAGENPIRTQLLNALDATFLLLDFPRAARRRLLRHCAARSRTPQRKNCASGHAVGCKSDGGWTCTY